MFKALAMILALALASPYAHAGGGFGARSRGGRERWQIDMRFGQYGQYDLRQKRRGHLKDADTSMLCGPVNLLNSLVRIREVLGLRSRFESLDQELAHLVALAPEDLIQNGISPNKLARLASDYLREQGIEAEVAVVDIVPGFDFARHLDEHSVLILLQGLYSVEDPTASIVSSDARKSGHFITLDGIPDEDLPKIHVHDPISGSRVIHLGGRVRFDDGSEGVWARRLKDSTFEDSSVLEKGIVIHLM